MKTSLMTSALLCFMLVSIASLAQAQNGDPSELGLANYGNQPVGGPHSHKNLEAVETRSDQMKADQQKADLQNQKPASSQI